MRITVELDENEIDKIKKTTGIRKTSPAVRKALQNYLKHMERQRFLQSVLDGKSGYSMTNEELEAMGAYDANDRHFEMIRDTAAKSLKLV